VIVDDFNRTFSMDGPAGPNGIRLHYEMMRVARTQAKTLRDFDVRAESHEAALAEMKTQFPDYIFLGTWAAAQAKMKSFKLDTTVTEFSVQSRWAVGFAPASGKDRADC
jgi:hypothetical protein